METAAGEAAAYTHPCLTAPHALVSQGERSGSIQSIILNNHDDLFVGSQETFEPPARRAG
jgi:hypothetical protein